MYVHVTVCAYITGVCVRARVLCVCKVGATPFVSPNIFPDKNSILQGHLRRLSTFHLGYCMHALTWRNLQPIRFVEQLLTLGWREGVQLSGSHSRTVEYTGDTSGATNWEAWSRVRLTRVLEVSVAPTAWTDLTTHSEMVR